MTVRILIVDDEPDLEVLIRQRFRRQIRGGTYVFSFATSGREALEVLGAQPDTDIVLSDINMPEMDGLTLLAELRKAAPLVKTIIVSAYGDMPNIRTAMNRGAFDFVTKPIDFEDLLTTIQKTEAVVKQTKETLAALRENNILKMYVDGSVLQFMAGEVFERQLLSTEVVEGTVMFVDVCRFTMLSEQQPAKIVVDTLNRYLGLFVDEIVRNEGRVDKFIGDSVMGVFLGEHHVERALEAAVEIRKQVEQLRADHPDDPLSSLGVTAGVNTGTMISGNIGSERLERLDHTVIGDTVNTAAHFQTEATEGQILVSDAVKAIIQASFQTEEIGEVQLKHKSKPTRVYNVIA